MSSVAEDLYQLVGETLGCKLFGMHVMHGDRAILEYGTQGEYAQMLDVPGSCFSIKLFPEHEITPNEKEIEHIRKIFNIFSGIYSDAAGRAFCGAEILETITSKKAIDEVMRQLIDVLVTRGGFRRAGIMFLNEALLELRGVIYADSVGEISPGGFKNVKLTFETKNDLSDIMFYDRTDIVKADKNNGLESIEEYFCSEVMVTGLGVGDRPIGILLACKDHYSESDKEALLLYGNICSLSIEFSRTVKQLELTMADLSHLRKTTMNAENLVKMGRLSATVAHELKNPLVAIGGFTKRMEQTAVNPQTKNYIKIVQLEVHRLERIVGDILMYSQRVDLEISEFSLSSLVSEVIDFVRGCLCFSIIEVTVRVNPELKVHADRDKLRQVLMNLISNSVQEMTEGGELTVEASESERHVTLSVTDTGEGIPVDKREKIFEPFYTLKKTGTGLGLPLCKKIMAAHGGDIVVGGSGTGAVFTLILPKRG
ncbi:sensor histidine kinase [Deferribacteres bacterium DY0037]